MTIKPQRLAQAQIKYVITLYSNGQIQEAFDTVETLIKDYPNEALTLQYKRYQICQLRPIGYRD